MNTEVVAPILPEIGKEPSGIRDVIVIDGTWQQARKMHSKYFFFN